MDGISRKYMGEEYGKLKAMASSLRAENERLQAEAATIILIAEKTCDDCFRVCHLRGRSTWIHGKENTGGAAFLSRYKAMEAVVEAAKKRKVAKAHFDKLFEAAMQDNDMTPQLAGEVGLTELDVWQADDVLDAALAALAAR